MKVLLRGIAVLSGVSVLLTILFLASFVRVGLRPLLATGAFGVITVIGWGVTFIAGPVATINLFRLRNSGRIAAAVLFGYTLSYYLLGIAYFHEPSVALAPLGWLCAALAVVTAALLSPAAKRTCVRLRQRTS